MSVPAAVENGPCFKRKPWIPPPARTTKDDAPREYSRVTSACRREPLCPGENGPIRSSSSPESQTLPRPMVHTEKLGAPLGPGGIFTCTDGEVTHQRQQGLGQQGAAGSAASGQPAVSRLSQVLRQLEGGCEDLARELQRQNEATASARHTLELAQSHMQTLRAIQAVAREHWEDPENRSGHFKDKLAELKAMLAALRDRNDTVPKVSGMIDHVWEQVVHIFKEGPHSRGASDDLVKHLNLCLREKEALVARLERELGYQEVRVEREQIRLKRCLDALEVAHRQHRDEKKLLQSRLRSMDHNLDKCKKALDHTALLLNRREEELAQARRDQLDALAAGGQIQHTLDMVQRKLIELEPVGKAAANDRKHCTVPGKQDKSVQTLNPGIEDEGYPPKHSTMRPELAKTAAKIKGHGHLHRVERSSSTCSCGDVEDGFMTHGTAESRNLQFERMQVDEEYRNIMASVFQQRNAGDVSDKEKEKLRKQVAELQEQLIRVVASNRNLTSYIANLRRSYAAVFRDTPESSVRPEDEEASFVEDC